MQSRSARFPFLLGLLVLAHLFLHAGLGIGRAAPDLLVVAALLASRRTSATAATGIGVGLGLLDDVMGMGGFGVRAFALGVAAYLGARSRQLVEGESLLFLPVYLFAGVWTAEIVAWVVSGGIGPLALVTTAPLSAAYATVAGLVSIALHRRMASTDA